MLDSLRSLLEEQIKDLYSAENQLIKALPKMAKKASSEKLRRAIEDHLEETKGQAERLADAARLLEIKPGGKVCQAMKGLIEEGKEALEEEGHEAVIDAAIIAAAQRVEHYEMSAYNSARSFAERLGMTKVVRLLQATLEEETAADEKLEAISVSEVVPAADAAEQEGSNESEQGSKDGTKRSASKSQK
jgi:ferritin-like metal-binding protein YciE